MEQGHSHGWKSREARGRWLIRVVGVLAAVALSPAASAEEPYFAGQTIDVLSGYSDGNEGNTIMQEWGRALERLHPDTRVIVHTNSGGTSALNAALLADSEPDGFTVGSTDMDSILAKASGEDIKDVTQFAIVGAMGRRQETLFASTGSGIKSLDDLKEKAAIIAVRSTQSNDYFLASLLNAYLGTRINPVTGYSSAERDLAFQSGESQLAIFNKPEAERALEDGIGVPLLVLSETPMDGALANVPTLAAAPGNESFAWIKDLVLSFAYHRIIATRADVPPDRLEILRSTHMAVTQEPGFVEAVKPLVTLSPIDGKTMQDTVQASGARGDDFPSRLQEALACGKRAAETGEKCGSGT